MDDKKTNSEEIFDQLMRRMDLLEKKVSKEKCMGLMGNAPNESEIHEDKSSVWVVILTLMKAGVVMMQKADEQMRIFSSEDKACCWLKKNGFFLGRRSFLTYKDDAYEWMQQYDRWDKYINVTLMQIDIDDFDDLEF